MKNFKKLMMSMLVVVLMMFGTMVGAMAATNLQNPKVSVKNETSGVNVSWSTSDKGLSKYRVYRKTKGGSWEKMIDITDTTKTSFVDKTAKNGTTYYYTVRSVKNSTWSGYKSSSAITRVSSPKVSVSFDNSFSVTIKWDAVPGATQYAIYRKVNGGKYTKILTISGPVTSYVTPIDYGTGNHFEKYQYTVKAYNKSWSGYKSSKYIGIQMDANGRPVPFIEGKLTNIILRLPYLKWDSHLENSIFQLTK